MNQIIDWDLVQAFMQVNNQAVFTAMHQGADNHGGLSCTQTYPAKNMYECGDCRDKLVDFALERLGFAIAAA